MRDYPGFVNGSLAEKTDIYEQPYYGMNNNRDGRYRNRNGRNSSVSYEGQYLNINDTVPDYAMEKSIEEAKRKEQNEAIAANRKILKKEISMRKKRRIVRIKYIFMISVLFVVFVTLIYRYNLVIEINSAATAYNSNLGIIRNNADVLKKDISKATDIEKVKFLAETRLNMQKPDAHQYIYIKVPRKDHAVISASEPGRSYSSGNYSIKDKINEIAKKIWLR